MSEWMKYNKNRLIASITTATATDIYRYRYEYMLIYSGRLCDH